MELTKQDITEIAKSVSTAVVKALKKEGLVGSTKNNLGSAVGDLSNRSAYEKTESLLMNYMGLKRVVREKEREIEEIRANGVPDKRDPFGERVQSSPVQSGIVLPEESVESAVHRVHCTMQPLVQAIAMVDKGMDGIKHDYYYKVLEMLYFERRTQEDIALEYGCSQVTISNNKSRLVRELAIRLFPDQAIEELISK